MSFPQLMGHLGALVWVVCGGEGVDLWRDTRRTGAVSVLSVVQGHMEGPNDCVSKSWDLDQRLHLSAPALTGVPSCNRNQDLGLMDWIHIFTFFFPVPIITSTVATITVTDSDNSLPPHSESPMPSTVPGISVYIF